MKRIITYLVIAVIILGGGYMGVSHLLRSRTRAQAAKVLAEVIMNNDEEFCDLAAVALSSSIDEGAVGMLKAGFECTDSACKKRILQVVDELRDDVSHEILLAALEDEDSSVACSAVLCLVKRGKGETFDLARHWLDSDDPELIGRSYEILAYEDDGFLPTLQGILNSGDEEYMPYAIRGLVPMVNRGNEKAWRLLKNGIGSKYPEVRLTSFESAVSLGGEKRREAIMEALNSTDPSMRRRAMVEITSGDDIAGYEEEMTLALNDRELPVVIAASWGLLKLGKAAPVPHLRSVIRKDEVLLKDKIVASRILARLGDEESYTQFVDLLKDPVVDELTRLEVAEVLAEYDIVDGMAYLGEAVKPGSSAEIRIQALKLLGIMGKKENSTLLKEVALDADEEVAVRAAYSLTASDNEAGIKYLKRFLKSESAKVRTIAAIGILTGGDMDKLDGF